jgi:uncharacterized protein (DUF488 family)
MEVYSVGFTKKKAKEFFELLKDAKIARLIDVRMNNSCQLAAFAKRDDLQYFLHEICGAEYVHEPLLAPTQELLDSYKKKKGSWEECERKFLALMEERNVAELLDRSLSSNMSVARVPSNAGKSKSVLQSPAHVH